MSSAAPKRKAFDRGGRVWPPRPNAKDDHGGWGSEGLCPPAKNQPISQHQSIQIKLAEMATKLEASRLLTEQAAKAYDSGNRSDLQAGMAKLFATETALFNSTEAMRIHGGFGYSPEYNIERYYRDAPLLAIGEGTNELQKLIIAKQLVSDN